MPLVANSNGLHHHREGADAMGEKSEDLPLDTANSCGSRGIWTLAKRDDAEPNLPIFLTSSLALAILLMSHDSQHDVKLMKRNVT